MDWQEYLILYEDINRVPHLQELLGKRDVKVTFKKLDGGPNRTSIDYRLPEHTKKGFNFIFRSQLKEIKSTGHQRIVLDCSTENIHQFLSHAQQVGMMTGIQI